MGFEINFNGIWYPKSLEDMYPFIEKELAMRDRLLKLIYEKYNTLRSYQQNKEEDLSYATCILPTTAGTCAGYKLRSVRISQGDTVFGIRCGGGVLVDGSGGATVVTKGLFCVFSMAASLLIKLLSSCAFGFNLLATMCSSSYLIIYI